MKGLIYMAPLFSKEDFAVLLETGKIEEEEADFFLPIEDLNNLFSKNEKNHAGNAILGWVDQDFSYGYIEGFYKAAHLLYSHLTTYTDFLVYPVIYLYRHYVELCLKEILLCSCIRFNEPLTKSNNHDLLSLKKQVCDILDKEEYSFLIPEEIRKVITELHNIDSNNSYFRYAYQNDGELSHSYDHKMINLLKVHYGMNTVHNYFESIMYCFDSEGLLYNHKLDIYFKAFVKRVASLIEKKHTDNIENLLRQIKVEVKGNSIKFDLSTLNKGNDVVIVKANTGDEFKFILEGGKIKSIVIEK